MNHYTWENTLPAGQDDVDGIPVHRYPVTWPRDRDLMIRLQAPLDAGFRIPASLEEEWVRNTGYSEPLMRPSTPAPTPSTPSSSPLSLRLHRLRRGRQTGQEPIQPLLHDEAYARFDCVQRAMRGAAGILWISAGERGSADRLIAGLPPGRLIGAGVDPPSRRFDEAAERRRLGIDGVAVSYAGRREGAKNFPLVAEVVAAANLARHRPLTLVAMGDGP